MIVNLCPVSTSALTLLTFLTFTHSTVVPSPTNGHLTAEDVSQDVQDASVGLEHRDTQTFEERNARLISMLMMIRLQNSPCLGENGANGTCYPRAQCIQLGGAGSGTCAAGFGVCCVFQKTCNSDTTQNVTYFVNPDYPTNYDGTLECPITIHKVELNICQFRLDFEDFTLAQPEPVDHICESDVFVVSGGRPVPPICGENTGQHMYIDAGPSSGNIKINIVTSGESFPRKWKIRISQIPCNAQYRAADSCLQYFSGMSGRIKSFNYGDPSLVNSENMEYGMQLSAQEYSICMRAEEGFCGIVYVPCRDTAEPKETFAVSSTSQGSEQTGLGMGMIPGSLPSASNVTGMILSTTTQPPSRTLSGAEQCPSDWIGIPCATDTGRETQTDGSSCIDRICGGAFSSLSGSMSHAPVYSFSRPFNLRVHFNDFELTDHRAPDEKNRGFCLDYVQQPCPQWGRSGDEEDPLEILDVPIDPLYILDPPPVDPTRLYYH